MAAMISAAADRASATEWIGRLHDEITTLMTGLDGGGQFHEHRWDRPGGGGGVSRALTEGITFEKAGVNRSAVEGTMAPGLAERLGAQVAAHQAARFFATGVSLVIHPRSPRIPTVHLNVRYFQFTDESDGLLDRWVAGGTDLTPMYPEPDDATHFHRALKRTGDRFAASLYPRFKGWCDEYFQNRHRRNEARGVGGVFFDNLRSGDPSGLDFETLWGFTDAVGRCLPEAWGPIVERHRGHQWTDRERRLQLLRRGRYVEFNLVHDRGTLFGLKTDARIESVLMSLPPLAAWEYDPQFEPGSIEAQLTEMLAPRDWAGGA